MYLIESKMKFCAALIIACIMALHSTIAQDVTDEYCDETLCRTGTTHIACNNDGAFKADCSADAKLIAISIPLRDSILQKHNNKRNFIAGGGIPRLQKAARMAYVKWSASLALLAKFNALQCVAKIDECRNTDVYRNAGQNIALSTWSGFDDTVESVASKQIEAWYVEHAAVSMQQINSYRTLANLTVIGHFTQLMQDKAHGVGCAIVRQTKAGVNEQLLVCNYAINNLLNQPVYMTAAKAGAKCATGKHPKYANLCSANEKYKI